MILYEDTALVVLDKPDAYVGVIHRLDTGVSGLMVYAKTPQAAASLSRQVAQSQQYYAVQDGRAEPAADAPDAPPFRKEYRALIAYSMRDPDQRGNRNLRGDRRVSKRKIKNNSKSS